MSLLEVRDLRVHFPGPAGVARAVDGVSFTVETGEVVGLVGESGCGKTVTALSILGLVPGPAGHVRPGSSILFGGEELVGAPERRLRRLRGREVAMIFQEPMTSLNPVQRVGDQVGEVFRAHLGLSRREARGRAASLLAEVGIPDAEARTRAYPHELSGGMRQRVMIAMALACEPALLVADEPTTALDVTVQAQILSLLSTLRARHGLALLLVTHDLGVVAETCDRVLVMYAGQVVESGKVEDVFRRPVHPYTRALLELVPRLDEPDRSLRPIPGAVPPATAWPPACRFAPRCAHAWTRCREEGPPMLAPGEDRAARCWLVEEPGRWSAGGTREGAP